MALIIGTNGPDTLTGGDEADEIHGGAGKDTIKKGAGDDIVFGDDGDDKITIDGSGSKTIHGGNSSDEFLGDFITANYGVHLAGSKIYGDAGTDLIDIETDGTGTLLIDGGDGNDEIRYGVGDYDVTIYGGTGNDRITFGGDPFENGLGGSGVIDAGDGNDTILFVATIASLTLGLGADTIRLDYLKDMYSDRTADVKDFQTGVGGDSFVKFSALLYPWDGSTNPFSGGYARLLQDGPDTLFQLDVNGNGDRYNTVLTLRNVQANTFVASNTDGWDPQPGIVAGLTLIGSEISDILTGGSGNDSIMGLAGDDKLIGGRGNDYLDGGLGIDRSVYQAPFRSYAPTIAANGVVTLHGGAAEGTDTLTSVEYITFADGSFISDPSSAGAQVIRMYDTVLGRPADASGLDFWLDQIEDQGAPLVAVANFFAASTEFQQATGGLGNAAFVDYVYAHALGRAADSGGKAYWTGQLNAGLSRGDMLVNFSESAEHQARTAAVVGQGYFNTDDTYQAVALLYDGFNNRLPDASGLIYWSEQVKSGTMSLGQVAASFAASTEFANATRGLSNAQLVDFMYHNTLDRGADIGGLTYWTGQLDHGLSKGDLLLAFSESTEHANLDAANIINGIAVA